MKLPYKGITVGTQSETITNPFSGASCLLSPEAVAVYDTIRGCEIIQDYKGLQKGLDWFRRQYPSEYMILLD